MGIRKNIIFYFSDQQRWDTVNEQVTPNLMELAADGVKFESSFTCQPVCGPARSCLQTGLNATQSGCFKNGISLPKEIKPLAEYFNEAGYDTAYVGKWHLASDDRPSHAFHCEKTAVPRDRQGGYRYWRAVDILEFTSHGYDGYLFDNDGNQLDFKGYRPDCVNDFALEYLEKGRDPEKPFFLFLSQIEPHHQNDHHRYEGYRETVGDYQNYPIPGDLSFLKGDYREQYPDYISAINRLDYNVGRMVQKLKDLGLYEDTVILYTSDHGSHFKTRNMEYKRSCHEGSIHTPLIIRGGEFRGGIREQRLVSLLDIPPTLLSIAGIPVPDSYAGHDVTALMKNDRPTRDCVFIQISESHCGRAIRTPRYTYSIRGKGGWKTGWFQSSAKVYYEDYLYDLEKDPCEKVNLVKNPRYKEVRRQLREMLVREMRRAGEETPVIRSPLIAKKK